MFKTCKSVKALRLVLSQSQHFLMLPIYESTEHLKEYRAICTDLLSFTSKVSVLTGATLSVTSTSQVAVCYVGFSTYREIKTHTILAEPLAS